MDALKDYLSGLSTADVGAISAIIVLVLFGRPFLRLFASRTVRVADDDGKRKSRGEKRVETLGHVFVSIGSVALYSVAVFLLLGQLGVDLWPVQRLSAEADRESMHSCGSLRRMGRSSTMWCRTRREWIKGVQAKTWEAGKDDAIRSSPPTG